jgi:predicted negative regulator of RcsB-dependent stress response
LVLGASSLPSSKTNTFHKKSSYLLLAFVILIIGIIIFIIYWKKQQRHSYSSTYRNTSKKAKIPSKFDSPASNDGDVITMDEASETSIVQDEE